MISEVAKILALSLMPMYASQKVTVLGGLVKVASQEIKEKQIEKFPIPYSAGSQPMQISNDAFIPDSSQRAIIYFEGSDSNVTMFENNKSRFKAALRLICWYNADKFQTDDDSSVHISLLAEILGLLPSAKRLSDQILALDIVPGSIIDSTPRLFSQYSYKEEKGQYLLPPYYALGIDLTTTFQINHGCNAKLKPVESGGCC